MFTKLTCVFLAASAAITAGAFAIPHWAKHEGCKQYATDVVEGCMVYKAVSWEEPPKDSVLPESFYYKGVCEVKAPLKKVFKPAKYAVCMEGFRK